MSMIIMYIYHAFINALSAHMVHINLNTIVYIHVVHSPTKTVYIRYYMRPPPPPPHPHTHARALTVCSRNCVLILAGAETL